MDIDVMICDHAQVVEGKLFISGGGIDQMLVQAGTPAPYVANFAVGGLVRVPWTATNREHVLTFRFVTEDGSTPSLPSGMELGADGVGGDMRFNVGRPPNLASGQEQMVPFGFNFQGLPLMEAGRYVIMLALDGTEIRRLGFAVNLQASSGFQGIPLQ